MYNITERQLHILKGLFDNGKIIRVCTVSKTQDQLARELNISRQALSVHLRALKEAGYLRTGRGFLDLTEQALKALGHTGAEAFIFIKINPPNRKTAYDRIQKLDALHLYRVTGDIDLIAHVNRANLEDFLRSISEIEGVLETSAHVILNRIDKWGSKSREE